MSVYYVSVECFNVSTEAQIVDCFKVCIEQHPMMIEEFNLLKENIHFICDHKWLIESEDSQNIHFLFEKIADKLKIKIHISLIEILQYAENEYSLILCASIDTTSNPNYDYDITENAKISNWLCSHKCRMVQLRE